MEQHPGQPVGQRGKGIDRPLRQLHQDKALLHGHRGVPGGAADPEREQPGDQKQHPGTVRRRSAPGQLMGEQAPHQPEQPQRRDEQRGRIERDLGAGAKLERHG